MSGVWYGAGIWAAGRHSAPATFVDSLGLGNALTGSGIHLETGWNQGGWELAGQINAWREPDGQSRLIIQRFHVAYSSRGGWRTALEQEPLVWGYGLNGGYVLGEAARPFPRLRLESPFSDWRLWGVPLGSWKGQLFFGQIEGHKVISESSQDPSYRARLVAANGDPQRPFLSGIRLESRFGADTEFYLNYINFFGGSIQGHSLTDGYRAKDWLTSFFGLKDSLAEGNQDFNGPQGSFNPQSTGIVKSASTSDVGIRVRITPFEQVLGAEDVRFYVSRGAKAVNTRFQILASRPFYAIRKDIEADWQSLWTAPLRPLTLGARYVLPSTPVPNDAVGLLIKWPGIRVGFEYLDAVNSLYNPDNPGYYNHRVFEHSTFASGFYQEGDPLGNAIGGEANTFTVRCEVDWSPSWTSRSWLFSGGRPFRDDQEFWQADHPGSAPATDRFFGLQQVVEWRPNKGFKAAVGASTQRQSAYLNQRGQTRTGFRWFMDLGWTWGRL